MVGTEPQEENNGSEKESDSEQLSQSVSELSFNEKLFTNISEDIEELKESFQSYANERLKLEREVNIDQNFNININ